MTTDTVSTPAPAPLTIKDLNTDNPRWCAGCGDFGIIMGLKRFIVDRQLVPSHTVNVSGIGCSGRAPRAIGGVATKAAFDKIHLTLAVPGRSGSEAENHNARD